MLHYSLSCSPIIRETEIEWAGTAGTKTKALIEPSGFSCLLDGYCTIKLTDSYGTWSS